MSEVVVSEVIEVGGILEWFILAVHEDPLCALGSLQNCH